MTRKRLSGADRRASILKAAQTVFARDGFHHAKTQQIAKAANVSEALIFRHFPTKTALYRAVLRKLVTDQDASFASYGTIEENASGLVAMMERTFRHALRGRGAPNADGMRLLFGSLIAENAYARLVYRRARRIILPSFSRAVAAARAAGDIEGPELAPTNISAFIEHVSSMMMIMRMPDKPSFDYGGSDDETLLRDAVWFCARGIGIRDSVIAAHFAPSPAQSEPAARSKPRRRARKAA